jgi:hypothetical protein
MNRKQPIVKAAAANKVECRPVRTRPKSQPKTVQVRAYKRSEPSPLPKCPKPKG